MAYKGLVFKNQATPDQPLIIEIEGTIGYEPWENPAETISTKEQMMAELKTIGDTQRDKVIVRINGCLGGDVNHAITMHDLLKTNFKVIETEANGTIASAAVVIFAAGSVRRQSDNSLILIHRASTFACGNVNDFKQATDDLVKFDDRIINIFIKATGKSLEEITALMDANNGNGKWLLPKEAKTSGLTTDIFEPTFQIAASVKKEILNRYGYPTPPAGFLNQEEPEIKSPQLKNIFKTVRKMIDKATNPANPNPQNTMIKQFLNLNTALGVEKLESADEKKGVYLNEAQLESISNAIQTATDAKATAESALATAKTDHEAAVNTITDAKTTAEAALATAITEVDEIDKTVKDAKTVAEKVTAIKAVVAAKPAVPAPGTQGTEDPNSGAADGIKHEILDKLDHQKVAAKMFGYDSPQ